MAGDSVHSLGPDVPHILDDLAEQVAHPLGCSLTSRRRSSSAFSPATIVQLRIFLIADGDHFRVTKGAVGPFRVRTIGRREFNHARASWYFLAVRTAGGDFGQPIWISGAEFFERLAQVLAGIIRGDKSRQAPRRILFTSRRSFGFIFGLPEFAGSRERQQQSQTSGQRDAVNTIDYHQLLLSPQPLFIGGVSSTKSRPESLAVLG